MVILVQLLKIGLMEHSIMFSTVIYLPSYSSLGDPNASVSLQVTLHVARLVTIANFCCQADRKGRGAWAIFPGAQPTEQPRRDPGGG